MLAWLPRVGLHVGVLGAEELLGAVAGQVLDHVDILAAAVVAPAGIAFGILLVSTLPTACITAGWCSFRWRSFPGRLAGARSSAAMAAQTSGSSSE